MNCFDSKVSFVNRYKIHMIRIRALRNERNTNRWYYYIHAWYVFYTYCCSVFGLYIVWLTRHYTAKCSLRGKPEWIQGSPPIVTKVYPCPGYCAPILQKSQKFRLIWGPYRTYKSAGYGCESVTELTEVPGIVAQAYRTHRSSGQVLV